MKANHCDECLNFRKPFGPDQCSKGHRPRFYEPKSPMDMDWGWKRRCEEFAPIPDDAPHEGGGR